MADHEPAATPAHDPDTLPRHTTPTWEVELLISGVAVFAMLQLPGWLDQQFTLLHPRLDADWAEGALYLYMYLKAAALILAVTFATHLTLRAHWIALVGMHSVFPEGVRPRDRRLGPIQRELDARQQLPREQTIDRADNRSTIVFAIGVVMATRLVLICVMVVVGFALANALTGLTGLQVPTGFTLLLVLAVVLSPLLIARSLDRRLGSRLPVDSRVHRSLAAILKFYTRVRVMRNSEVIRLLAGRVGERRIFVMTVVGFMAVFITVMISWKMQRSLDHVGNYGLFPFGAGTPVMSATYADERDVERSPVTAYIQSLVVDGPYLKLVVPYEPAADGSAQRRQCPTAVALDDGPARQQALLDCLARLHPVSLDGHPVADLHYAVGDDATAARPALVALVDVRGLSPGAHVLRVGRKPRPDRSALEHDAGPAYVIPFWR